MINERKPLVTMADVRLHCGELNEREAVACRWIIERYERMITEGKLRVVEEVVGKPTDSGEYQYHCGHVVSDAWGYRANFCPGCGNPIKR
jgi:hypothetical protein